MTLADALLCSFQQCAFAVAAAAMAWLSNDIHIIVGTGATVIATGGAVAALTAARSGFSNDDLLIESEEEWALDESFASDSYSSNTVNHSYSGADGSFAAFTNAQDTMTSSTSEPARDQQSSANLAREWQQNQAAERLSVESQYAPLEISDSYTSNDDVYDPAYDDAFTGPQKPATASALYSSSASAQLDSAPVPLATKIERLKLELELAREWQETNMAIKPAPPLHNGYQPVADPLHDLKPPSMRMDDGPPKFPDPPIISGPTFPAGKSTHGSNQEIATKLKAELDLAREFFDDA